MLRIIGRSQANRLSWANPRWMSSNRPGLSFVLYREWPFMGHEEDQMTNRLAVVCWAAAVLTFGTGVVAQTNPTNSFTFSVLNADKAGLTGTDRLQVTINRWSTPAERDRVATAFKDRGPTGWPTPWPACRSFGIRPLARLYSIHRALRVEVDRRGRHRGGRARTRPAADDLVGCGERGSERAEVLGRPDSTGARRPGLDRAQVEPPHEAAR